MSKIRKLIAILLVVLFLFTVTLGAVSAKVHMTTKEINSLKSTGSPAHSPDSKAGKYTVSLTVKNVAGKQPKT